MQFSLHWTMMPRNPSPSLSRISVQGSGPEQTGCLEVGYPDGRNKLEVCKAPPWQPL